MEVVLINDNATIPTRASKRSAGLDLYSSVDVCIEVGSIKKNKYWNMRKILMDLLEINQLKDYQY